MAFTEDTFVKLLNQAYSGTLHKDLHNVKYFCDDPPAGILIWTQDAEVMVNLHFSSSYRIFSKHGTIRIKENCKTINNVNIELLNEKQWNIVFLFLSIGGF